MRQRATIDTSIISMKNFLLLVVVCLGCSNPKKYSDVNLVNDDTVRTKNTYEEQSRILVAQILEDNFPKWLSYQDSVFEKVNLDSFQIEQNELWRRQTEEVPTKEYLDLLSGYLFYSKDSSKILDIYSGSIDFEKTQSGKLQGLYTINSGVFYYDLKTKTKTALFGERLYEAFEDAIWISNDVLVIVGDYCYREKRELSVWIVDLKSQREVRYFQVYPQKMQYVNDYLFKEKLKNVNVYLDDQ